MNARCGYGPGMGIGKRLRELRVRAGLSQQALADRIGTTPLDIRRYESGRVEHPRADRLAALAQALGVSIDSLTSEDDPEPHDAPPPVTFRVREWGEWMRDLPQDARRIVLRVGDALRDAARTDEAGRTSPPQGKGRKSRRSKAVG